MAHDDEQTRLLDRARQWLARGDLAEAILAHERLLCRYPAHADSWYNLGFLLHRARRYDAALGAYQQALERGAAGPEEIHLNRAVILAEQLGRVDLAEAELGRALERSPRYVPAWINLGNLHEQRGDRTRALQAYEAALAIEPRQALALARLANVMSPAGDAFERLVGRLRLALQRADLRADERADLGFGLGKALDALGSYDEAFEAYAAANRASRASAGTQGPRYDPAAHERFVDALIRAFPGAPAPIDGPPGPKPPVFICGMFRSGSTLIEQILASHPRVTAGGEIDLLPEIAAQHLGRWLREPRVPAAQADVRALAGRYLAGIAQRHPGADLLTDKRPDNFLYIGLIKCLFPHAKIVHTTREPIDNCLSVYFLHLSHAMPYAHDLLDIAHWYRQYRRLMAHWKAVFGPDIHDVHYDALVADPRPAIAGTLAHCGLDWDEACLEFHRTPTVVATPSAWQVRRPLYRQSSGRWRHYERHVQPLVTALGDASSAPPAP
jgi:tetratricopeptide (TPR) repeat protein